MRAVQALSMEQGQSLTDSDLARPPGGDIQPSSKPVQVFSVGAQRAPGAWQRSMRTRVPMTQEKGEPLPNFEGRCFPDDSRIKKERAGGGQEPTSGGP